jgi:hypothetical protein
LANIPSRDPEFGWADQTARIGDCQRFGRSSERLPKIGPAAAVLSVALT